jgi:hypothetical protein
MRHLLSGKIRQHKLDVKTVDLVMIDCIGAPGDDDDFENCANLT